MKDEEMLELMIRRQPPAWRRTTHVPIHRMDRSNGFSLVELMIVTGLTAVLVGIGALSLVSDVQVERRTNSVQETQAEWGRAVTFIQNEVANANRISDNLSVDYPCNDGDKPKNDILVLNKDAPASAIIYGVRGISDKQKSFYRGPQVLIRCGPIPPEGTSTPIETVLLDRLPTSTSLSVKLLANKDKGPVHDAELEIDLKTGAKKGTYSGIPFRVHVERTPSTP
jgi:prepilin-type N-terminal cleavage/methylation domain-containing protein